MVIYHSYVSLPEGNSGSAAGGHQTFEMADLEVSKTFLAGVRCRISCSCLSLCWFYHVLSCLILMFAMNQNQSAFLMPSATFKRLEDLVAASSSDTEAFEAGNPCFELLDLNLIVGETAN